MKKVLLGIGFAAAFALLIVPLIGGFSPAPHERVEIGSLLTFDLLDLAAVERPAEDDAAAVTVAALNSASVQGLGSAVTYRHAYVVTASAAPEVARVTATKA
ncbi:hypothetical protein [Nisaea sediminum]|uniref:hypothetical protein n=1 Tax=Nisaea sediminum TaxID=2775867 RepID=UPI001867296B|nr:hypothetical protein [Nisaea sediminum]